MGRGSRVLGLFCFTDAAAAATVRHNTVATWVLAAAALKKSSAKKVFFLAKCPGTVLPPAGQVFTSHIRGRSLNSLASKKGTKPIPPGVSYKGDQ